VIDYLRLAFGLVCVLAPGWAVARALGQHTMSAVLAWATASVFVAWTAVFAVHRSIHLAVAVLAVIFVAALVAGHWYRPRTRPEARSAVWLVGVVLGWFLWHVEGAVTGDGLFHEARVRKLVDLTSLHLRTVDEFKDGGLHPGYAFPLWHGLLALVSWFSGLDPATVVRHAPSVLAPVTEAIAAQSVTGSSSSEPMLVASGVGPAAYAGKEASPEPISEPAKRRASTGRSLSQRNWITWILGAFGAANTWRGNMEAGPIAAATS